MNIKDIQGLKYPDDYFIKFFFKKGLHKKNKQTYLELGCSNGCNLMLPYQFNNPVIGVDMDSVLIKYANSNFKRLSQDCKYDFKSSDMRKFCNENSNIQADVLVLCSSIYYIPKNDFLALIQNIQKNNLIKKEIPFFIRFREIDDFRNGKGQKVEENAYVMQNAITGEDDIFCQFYKTNDMLEILKTKLNLRNFEIMNLKCDNIQNDIKVNNSEVVIWGTIN